MFEEFEREKMIEIKEHIPKFMDKIKERLNTYVGLDLQIREIRDSLTAEIVQESDKFFNELNIQLDEGLIHLLAISCINAMMMKKGLMIGIEFKNPECDHDCENCFLHEDEDDK